MEFPDNPKPSEDEMVNTYVKTLAQVVGRKVIPRLQYRYSERQPSRNKPRPRHERRRETMRVERRDPVQRQKWSQVQGGPMQQSTPMYSQNSASDGENQEKFNRNSA